MICIKVEWFFILVISVTLVNYLNHSNWKKEGITLVHNWSYFPVWSRIQGNRSFKLLTTLHFCNHKKKDSNGCYYSFFLYSTREWYHTHWTSLQPIIKLVKIILQSHVQRPMSQMVLDLIRLTVQNNQ